MKAPLNQRVERVMGLLVGAVCSEFVTISFGPKSLFPSVRWEGAPYEARFVFVTSLRIRYGLVLVLIVC